MAFKYTVEPGDSYFGLARKFTEELGITVNPVDLLRLNNLTMATATGNAGMLRVGQKINIPEPVYRVLNPAEETDPVEEEEEDDGLYTPTEIEAADPIEDFSSDPAYQSFYAQYLLNIEDINQIRATQSTALLGSMANMFGDYEEGESPFDLEARSGGRSALEERRALDKNLNVLAGRGMAFGGGRFRKEAEISDDYEQDRTVKFAEYIADRDRYDAEQRAAFQNLEFGRLEQERAARERLTAEAIGARYV
tara:strand:+ start:9538 stop:10290 length:753 start_codon:yes stop_codon:yes gene_type:complete